METAPSSTSAPRRPEGKSYRRASVTNEGYLRRRLSLLLMAMGAALLAYVSLEYYGMYREQARLAAEWMRQSQVHDARQTANQIVTNALTRVTIPKVGVDAYVVDGTTPKQLKVAPGRMVDTALPGAVGNSVITAHRDTFFRRIIELKNGDEIQVRRNGELLRFQVTGQKIVSPTDMSVARQSIDPRLTLITCYPPYFIGPAPKRLAVFAKLVSRNPDDNNTALTAGHQHPDQTTTR